jgi:hypothetical protein
LGEALGEIRDEKASEPLARLLEKADAHAAMWLAGLASLFKIEREKRMKPNGTCRLKSAQIYKSHNKYSLLSPRMPM